MPMITQTVYFPGEAEEFRDVEIEVIPSNKVLRDGSGLPVEVGPPSYRLAGYSLEHLNMPARRDVPFLARKL